MKGKSENIRKTDSGKYQILWDEPTANGKRKQRAETVGTSLKEAQRRRREILQAIDEGTYAKQSKTTMAEYLPFWLGNIKGTVSESSFSRYARIVTNHLVAGLGEIRLSALRPMDIQALYKQWQEKGLSARTIRLHHAVLHRALEAAVKWEEIPKNPATYAEPPRTDDAGRNIMDVKALHELLSSVKGTPYHGPVALAITTGMRIGEICALRWEGVDLEARRLSVYGTISRLDGKLLLRTPKTDRAKRMIDLPDEVIEILRCTPRNGAFVFPRSNGEPRDPDTISNAVRSLCRAKGIRFTMHGLRHSHATWLMENGFNPKIVAERLGHSKVAFTLQTYSHVTPPMQREVADAVAVLLTPTPGPSEI